MNKPRYYTIKTKKKKLKTGRLIFLLVLFAFLLSIILSVRFLGTLNAIQDKSPWSLALPKPESGQRQNILVYCVSDRDTEGLITGIVLVAYHREKKDFRAIHIPLDVMLEVEEHGHIRLAQIYNVGGKELLIDAIAALINIPIHTYVEINEDFIPTAIDRINGAAIKTELKIENGGDVLPLIHADGITPAERLEQRRRVLTALSSQVVTPGILGRVRSFLRVSPLVNTNLSWRELLSFLTTFKSTSYEDVVQLEDLPITSEVGADGSYSSPKTEAVTVLAMWLNRDIAGLPNSQITVEVLNGSGIKGLANEVADKLREEGFNVVRIGNADRFDIEKSQVISRLNNMDAAKEVAILVPNAQLLKEEISGRGVDVTVIIGKEYSLE